VSLAEPHTFREECEEWLPYVEHDRQRSASTLRDYRNTVRPYLLPGLRADTPLDAITTEDIDGLRERMLGEGRFSRRSIQKILVILHGILKRAKRTGVDRDEPGRGRRAHLVQALGRLLGADAGRGRGPRARR
jgi:hypothetical protein